MTDDQFRAFDTLTDVLLNECAQHEPMIGANALVATLLSWAVENPSHRKRMAEGLRITVETIESLGDASREDAAVIAERAMQGLEKLGVIEQRPGQEPA